MQRPKHHTTKKSAPWSKTKEAKEKRVKQREIRAARRRWKESQKEAQAQAQAQAQSSSSSSSNGREDDDDDEAAKDWEQLKKEKSLRTKLKKGKISKCIFKSLIKEFEDNDE